MSAFQQASHDQPALRQRIDEARVLEQELATQHAYAKYKAHLDFFEIGDLGNTLSV